MGHYMHSVMCNHFPGENIGNKISESQIRVEFLQVFPQHSIVTFHWSQNRPETEFSIRNSRTVPGLAQSRE